jgi:hypothetical protein
MWKALTSERSRRGPRWPLVGVLLALAACARWYSGADGPARDGGPESGPGACGNGRVEGGELCDGAELRGQTCASLGLLSGSLGCTSDCRYDIGGCTSCGDGKVRGIEECDGSELQGKSCASLGFSGGALACRECRLDTTSCAISTAGHATVAYGTASELVVRRLDLPSGTWGPRVTVPGIIGEPRWIVNRVSPRFASTREEVAAALTETPSELRLHLAHAGSGGWIVDEMIKLPVPPLDADKRVFDLICEASSGEVLLVYSDNTSNPVYRTFAAGSWSAPQKVFASPPGSAAVRWVVLARRAASDEIAVLYADAETNLMAAFWDGGRFIAASNSVLDVPSAYVHQFFDAAYEAQSGDLLVPHGNSCCMCFDYSLKAPADTFWQTGLVPPTLCVGLWTFMKVAARRGTDQIALVGDRWTVGTWDGASWTSVKTLWTGSPWFEVTRWADVAWVGGAPAAVVVFRGWTDPETPTNPGHGKLFWARYASAAWQQGTPVPVEGLGELTWVRLEAFPRDDRVLALFSDDGRSLWAASYDESKGWTVENGGAALAVKELSTAATRPFSVDIWQP